MMMVRENGFYDKLVQTSIHFTYHLFVDKDFTFHIEKAEQRMELDEMKIAIGPYLFGTTTAFIVFVL